MYFYKLKGRQILDMRGDLVLTHNDALVKGRVKSAAPAGVRNALYVEGISGMGLRGKLKATRVALVFIWGPSVALKPDTIEEDGL